MFPNLVYVVWLTTSGLDEDARLIGVYSSEEGALERIVRCRELPGYASELVDFVITRTEVDHSERSQPLIDA